MKTSVLKDKAFAFAVDIVRLAQQLRSEKNEFVLSKQIVRSGTSPGANNREAEFAQSKKYFINKMSIALKETNETEYFLELLFKTKYIPSEKFHTLHKSCGEIKGMLISSVRTAKANERAKRI